MADTMHQDVRSKVMSRIRSRDTRPELFVRRTVWSQGFRYRLNVRRLPGTPDLVLARYGVILFVQGCFWHQHGCSKSRRPSSNLDYWEPKLNRNVDRDAHNHAKLRDLGWTVITIWECRLQEDTCEALRFLKTLRSRAARRWGTTAEDRVPPAR